MKLRTAEEFVDFQDAAGRLAGRYNFVSDFKPSLHPVNSPKGHTLTLSMPHDHKHHRGIMYALSARDVNFWEERQVRPNELVGIQTHLRFSEVVEKGDTVGFTEELLWTADDGNLATFRELRKLSCSMGKGRPTIEWRWSSRLEALRDVDIIMSHWSHDRHDGKKVNYHGLGIRFRRDFGAVSRGTAVYVDGVETSIRDALGSTPREVAFIGSLDGCFPAETAGMRLRQGQRYALFVQKDPFPLLTLGPSNSAPMSVSKGGMIYQNYEISVFDGNIVPYDTAGENAKTICGERFNGLVSMPLPQDGEGIDARRLQSRESSIRSLKSEEP